MAYSAKEYGSLIGMEGFSETLLKNHFTLYQGYVTNTKQDSPPRYVPADDVIGAWQTEVDRARDFIAVFNGESTREQGQRVFVQIERWCNPAPNLYHVDRLGVMAWKEGRRSVLKEILDASNPDRVRDPQVERKPKK